jgi:hypothetical protein
MIKTSNFPKALAPGLDRGGQKKGTWKISKKGKMTKVKAKK